jgi:hypothetical protein
MGSQPAFFYRVDPSRYAHLEKTATGELVLPPTIQKWTNVVEPFDLLSFPVSDSFLLHDGQTPTDMIERIEISPMAHSAYWLDRDLIRKILEGPLS